MVKKEWTDAEFKVDREGRLALAYQPVTPKLVCRAKVSADNRNTLFCLFSSSPIFRVKGSL
jgi:hypothetical protein